MKRDDLIFAWLLGTFVGLCAPIVFQSQGCTPSRDFSPAPPQPFDESDPHYHPKTTPVLTVPPGELYTVPSYPSCQPPASGLARIAGGTNIDAGSSRVRDRSPPLGVSV